MNGEVKFDLQRAVSDLIGLPTETIKKWAKYAPGSYKRYNVPKRSGGTRVILHPAKATKTLQYAILSILEPRAQIHDSAIAYRRGFASPLRKNAELHSKSSYLLRIDIQEFFPSLQPSFVRKSLPFTLSIEDYSFFTLSCFYRSKGAELGLPIGAPTSPLLSNMAMASIDEALCNEARRLNGTYTRYADDMVFSTDHSEGRDTWLEFASNILEHQSLGALRINETKTRRASRASRRSVTGVILTPNGDVSIGRDRKREIRVLLHKATERKLSEDHLVRLRGLLAFTSDIEPAFLERMIKRYGDIVLWVRRGHWLKH